MEARARNAATVPPPFQPPPHSHSTSRPSPHHAVLLSTATLLEGQTTEVFKRNGKAEFADLSFSLKYEYKGSPRTLDVVCKEKREVWGAAA